MSKILELEAKIKTLELTITDLKKTKEMDETCKALVVKKSQYDIIVFEE